MTCKRISLVHDWHLLAMSEDGALNPHEVDEYILSFYQMYPYKEFWGKVEQ